MDRPHPDLSHPDTQVMIDLLLRQRERTAKELPAFHPKALIVWECEVTRIEHGSHKWTSLFLTEELAYEYAAREIRREYESVGSVGWVRDMFECFGRREFKKGIEEHYRGARFFVRVRRAPVHGHVKNPCTVTINGQGHRLEDDLLTYEEIVLLSHPEFAEKAGPLPLMTISYDKAPGEKRDGCLSPVDPPLRVKDGTRINCYDTSNA